MTGLGNLRTREELLLAGHVSGLLYLAGAACAALMLVVPGPDLVRPWVIVLAAGLGLVWGLACVWIVPWERIPGWLSHASTASGLLIVTGIFVGTEGTGAPAISLLWFIVAFAAFFYRPLEAAAHIAGCLIVLVTMLVVYPDALGVDQGPRTLIVGGTVAIVVGVLIIAGRQVLVRLRDDAHHLGEEHLRLAEEQSALRRVATAVAAGSPPAAVFALVASEVARLVRADSASIVKLIPGDQAQVMGSWSRRDAPRYEPGTVLPIAGSASLTNLQANSAPVRVRAGDPAGEPPPPGFGVLLTTPITAGATLWGALSVATKDPDGLPAGSEDRLRDFAALAATAIANAEDRARLATLAAVDPLTGLANHRVFQERLHEEVGRARRHGRTVSVALIDIDHFADLNERVGAEAGDAVLRELALLLRSLARNEDLLARLGGDEFALLLTETDSTRAFQVVERARMLVAETAFGHRERLTLSAGVCDLDTAGDAESIYRLAEGALYWSKAHGRDVTWIYDPAVVRELNAAERAEQLERSQALTGLRALARAVDAKDASTAEHSERVAVMSERLATVSGWSHRRIAQLAEAALVHDVGKIGVPDAILLKPGPLTEDEYDVVKHHVHLGAQILSDVLSPEQVRWVESHHERPDGSGYPRGLHAHEIPEGGALLSLADAWDVMTCARIYSERVEIAHALAECRALVGRQFTQAAVDALATLHDRGELEELYASFTESAE
jgi:diguanylate cyclase (GGDEF)-like protein